MKIINATHEGEMGGGCEAIDIHFDNGYSVRIFNGNTVYLCKPEEQTTQGIDDVAEENEQSVEVEY